MSANNFYFAHKEGDTWYGWDAMAEAWGDHGENKPVKFHLVKADATAPTIQELERKLDEQGLGYSEYGLTTSPRLPKDGTPIEVVI